MKLIGMLDSAETLAEFAAAPHGEGTYEGS